jgi:microcompartment protein CcmK/EutM
VVEAVVDVNVANVAVESVGAGTGEGVDAGETWMAQSGIPY